jgi:hypothetical protein
VTRGWRKLHDEELHNFYALSDIVICSNQGELDYMGELRNAYKIFVGKP